MSPKVRNHNIARRQQELAAAKATLDAAAEAFEKAQEELFIAAEAYAEAGILELSARYHRREVEYSSGMGTTVVLAASPQAPGWSRRRYQLSTEYPEPRIPTPEFLKVIADLERDLDIRGCLAEGHFIARGGTFKGLKSEVY